MRIRKTRDEFQVWGDYGDGFEEVCAGDNWRVPLTTEDTA